MKSETNWFPYKMITFGIEMLLELLKQLNFLLPLSLIKTIGNVHAINIAISTPQDYKENIWISDKCIRYNYSFKYK